jgi:hypothetical protein
VRFEQVTNVAMLSGSRACRGEHPQRSSVTTTRRCDTLPCARPHNHDGAKSVPGSSVSVKIEKFDLREAWLWDWEQDCTGEEGPDTAALRAPHQVRS